MVPAAYDAFSRDADHRWWWSALLPLARAAGDTLRETFVVLERRSDAAWTSHRRPHLRRHHPDADVRSALAAAGLHCLGVYGQSGETITEARDDLRDEKAIYLARRPRAR